MGIGKMFFSVFWAAVLVLSTVGVEAGPVDFIDGGGHRVVMERSPGRVVSISPEITEMIYAIGAGGNLVGTTYHTSPPFGEKDKEVVGGFFAPCPERIKELNPDLVFLADRHVEVREVMAGGPLCVELTAHGLEDVLRNIETLGRVFDREEKAGEVVSAMEERFEAINQKVAGLNPARRLRVMRFMGRSSVMSPGDDSFQTAFIRAAGGVAPLWGRNGQVTEITLKEWQDFNPQVVYGCGGDREAMAKLLGRPGWSEVEAVRDNRYLIFPCDLTCRAATGADDMVEALATALYPDLFFKGDEEAPGTRLGKYQSLELDWPGVKEAGVRTCRILGFEHKTLLVEMEEPGPVLSTLHGYLENVVTVGNHYVPPPCWGALHSLGQDQFMGSVYKALGLADGKAKLLLTGADMDHLAVGRAEYRDMKAAALVTAGIKGNTMRMGLDQGDYYEPGTINIVLLTNRSLTPAAMARALITATEAKTAALQDMDIRSSYLKVEGQATGTGTDNVMVVGGTGARLDLTGGHCKMGELMARAVYQGVVEAVGRQNRVRPGRQVLYRLEERGLNAHDLAEAASPGAGPVADDLERLLLDPVYEGFMEEALALEDAWRRGLLTDMEGWRRQCRAVAGEVGGGAVSKPCPETGGPLELAVWALVSGLQGGQAPGSLRPDSPGVKGAGDVGDE